MLLSIVGTNDRGNEEGTSEGAVLTVFREREFDEVHLFWNPSRDGRKIFYEIAKRVKQLIVSRKLVKRVVLHEFSCQDVTDHNEIYPKLLALCKSLNYWCNLIRYSGHAGLLDSDGRIWRLSDQADSK